MPSRVRSMYLPQVHLPGQVLPRGSKSSSKSSSQSLNSQSSLFESRSGSKSGTKGKSQRAKLLQAAREAAEMAEEKSDYSPIVYRTRGPLKPDETEAEFMAKFVYDKGAVSENVVLKTQMGEDIREYPTAHKNAKSGYITRFIKNYKAYHGNPYPEQHRNRRT